MAKRYALIIGSSWIFRRGMKPLFRSLGLSVAGEGDTFAEAFATTSALPQPTLIIALIEQATEFNAALEQLHSARTRVAGAKLVAVANPMTDADIVAAVDAGLDALLSSKLSSRMLINSLQLVLHDQKLFPSLKSSIPSHPVPLATEAERPVIDLVVAPAAPVALAEADPAELATFPDPDIQPAAQSSATTHPMALERSQVVRPEGRSPMVRPRATVMNLVWRDAHQAATPLNPSTPSEREWEILCCLTRGGSNKSIARELGIAETTVKVHIKSLLRKLGVNNRTQAAIWALKHAETALALSVSEPTLASAATNGVNHYAYHGSIQEHAQ